MPRSLRSMLLLFLVAAVGLAACTNNATPNVSVAATPGPAQNAIQISIIYAPESEIYLKDAMTAFNQAYAEGRNPLTGQPLAQDEKPIYITGKSGSSGTVMQGIVNAIVAPNNQNVERPTIFSPSVSHWLVLANYQVGRDVFDLANSPATALAP